jgi:hypothetical protein
MFDAKNMMAASDPRQGRYLTVSFFLSSMILIFDDVVPGLCHLPWQSFNEGSRGTNAKCSEQNSAYFVEWIPNNVLTAQRDIPPRLLFRSFSSVSATNSLPCSNVRPSCIGTRRRVWTRWKSVSLFLYVHVSCSQPPFTVYTSRVEHARFGW